MKARLLTLLLLLCLPVAHDAKIVLMFKSYLPELPRSYVDTTYSTPGGSTIVVGGGGDFAAALTSANPGDIITLNAGSTYTGTFTLPAKGGSTYIYVISSALASLPAAGTRIALSDVANMPTIIGPSPSEPAINTNGNVAHHFRFVGIRFTSEAGESNNGLIRFGTGGETATNQFPHHLILDRCIVKGDTATGGRRGVLFAGNYLAVLDSYLYDWKGISTDCQGIAGWTGEGPWAVKNSYLEADSENMLVGGSDPGITNLIPSDIEVRGNTFSKPLTWNPNHASYDASTWTIKNLFELKIGKRVLITNNLFQHNWVGAQSGRAILFTVKNQGDSGGDGAEWSEISDVTFTNNVIAGVHSGFSLSGNDGGFPSLGGQKILIADNFIHDLGGVAWGETGGDYSIVFNMTGGMRYVTIRHNTVIHGDFAGAGAFIIADGAPYLDFRFTDNIVEHNTNGVKGNGTAIGNATLTAYFPSAIFLKNVIVSGNSVNYPANNYFPYALAEVGFVDQETNDFTLRTGAAISDVFTNLTEMFSFEGGIYTLYGNVLSTLLTNNGSAVSAIGKTGGAIDLEDDTQYLSVADSAPMSTGDVSFTINFWVKPESLTNFSGFPFLASKGWLSDDNANQEWGVAQNGTGQPLVFAVGTGTTTVQVINSNFGAIGAGSWSMVTVWHDATNDLIGIATNAGTANTQTTGGAAVNDGTRDFTIGSRSDGSFSFDGLVDNFAFFKGRVLTAQNRTDLFNGGAALSYSNMAAGSSASAYVAAATDGGAIGAPNAVIEALP